MMNYLCAFWRKWWPSIITFVLAAVMTGVFIWMGWGDLQVYNPPPRSEIVRNYGLLVVAFWGAFLAVWRSQIAKQQADSALQQAKSALRQAKSSLRQVAVSESGLRNERFQKGADMLGSKTFTVRMGGIYALGRLAQDHPEDYLDQVIELLAAFVRRPARDEETAKPKGASKTEKLPHREDVWEAVRTICELNDNKVVKHDQPNIARSDLSEMRFPEKNFSGMIMLNTNLTDCDLTGASLTKVDLTDANLTGATLTNTNISDAVFTGVEGLSQEQLDKACQSPDKPPPKNLPPDLTWDEKTAVERWRRIKKHKERLDNNYPKAD